MTDKAKVEHNSGGVQFVPPDTPYANLPPDVFPESGFRLPLPRREDMSDDDKATFDRIVSSTNAGINGPGGIQLHSPAFAAIFSQLVVFTRNDTGLPPRQRELAILTVAREIDDQFEWTAHEIIGQQVGLEQSLIDLVRDSGDVTGLAPDDAIIIRLGREAVGKRKVSPETFARAKEIFGARILVNICGLMGGYAAASILMAVFDMQLRPEWTPLLTPKRSGR